jgi:glycine hydroxymethyltransferase
MFSGTDGQKRVVSDILPLISQQEDRLRRTINLVASENLMSPAARRALSSDFAHRYCLPPSGERPADIWDYPNQSLGREIERLTKRAAQQLFGGAYVDLRPLSGNNIASILISTLARGAEGVFTVPGSAGGHFATAPICKQFGAARIDLPYDEKTGRIDIDDCAALAKTRKPKMIYLDASMILFPYPVAALRDIFGPDCIIAYDASHCFGLIAGGVFQAPFREGADFLVGSTHKSMFGPQKGMILAQNDDARARAVHEAITPLYVSNSHSHHVAALGIALEELIAFGRAYATQVVANARALAQALASEGLRPLYAEQGFTDSHQILCAIEGDALSALAKLERVGIHVNGVSLPFSAAPGLRIGAAESTRRGLVEEDMRALANCIADTLNERRSVAAVAAQVTDISRTHQDIHFTLSDATPAPTHEEVA